MKTTVPQPNQTNKNFLFRLCAIPVFFVTLMLGFSSCSNEDDSANGEFTDGVLNDIIDVVGEDNLVMIEEDLEVTIHRGETPPELEDIVVLMTPTVLTETNVPDDYASPGTTFNDAYIRIHNFNASEYEVQFDRYETSQVEPHYGEGSFVIGEGNNFTVFGPQEMEGSGDYGNVLSMNVYSGTLTDDGIENPQYALVMLDNGDNPGLIPNDTGRSFEDGDGFSDNTEWPIQKQMSTETLYQMAERIKK